METVEAVEYMLMRHGYSKTLPCEVLLGCDGVKESDKARSLTIEVVYISLLQCHRHPLALRLGRGYKNSVIDTNEMVDKVIDDFLATNNRIRLFAYISDKPARSKVNQLAEVASAWTCEHCWKPGVRMEYFDESGRKCGKVAFPYKENFDMKTHDQVKEWMEGLEDLRTLEDKRGYHKKSCLLKLPYFDIVNDVIVESLHGIFLGLQKRLVALIFAFDSDIVKGHMAPPNRFDPEEFIRQARPLKAPSDFNRGVQRLEIAMKGEELRNLCLCTIFLLVHIQSPRHRLVQTQLLFSYLVRAYMLPEVEFQWLQEIVELKTVSNYFQELFHKFHSYTWVYYTHAFVHVDKVRAKGPLTLLSMFPPEVRVQ